MRSVVAESAPGRACARSPRCRPSRRPSVPGRPSRRCARSAMGTCSSACPTRRAPRARPRSAHPQGCARPSTRASGCACLRARASCLHGRCREDPARAAPRRAAAAAATRRRGLRRAIALHELHREQRREQAQDREDRQQPATEVAALQAHEREIQKRRRHEHPAERPLAPPHAHRPAERRQRGRPAEAPGERPQVVGQPAVARRAELALGFGGERGLMDQFGVEVRVVEERVGVREQERRERPRCRRARSRRSRDAPR